MDNLTHSLIGALLGQAGLKRKSGLAMPALIIAANIPDIDAPCALYGIESLSMRRGITHGPIALVLLPLVLTALLVLFDRWQTRRGTRPEQRLPVRPGWLLALAYIGTLTHPAFDWLNSYGIRLLEPFSSQWFYGDALFIVDPWLLAMLGLGVWLSRRRDQAGVAHWQRPARVAVIGVLAYVALNLAISVRASQWVLNDAPYPQVAVANPVPLAFWRRDVLWRTADRYGSIPYSPFGPPARRPASADEGTPIGMDDPRVAVWAKDDPKAAALLFWSRMPVVQPAGAGIMIRDQRFLAIPARGGFSVTLEPKP